MTTIDTTAPATPSKGLHYGLWAAQLLLVVAFAGAGFAKVTTPLPELAQKMSFVPHFPGWFVRFIGVAELAAVLGLVLPAATRILPRLTAVAAIGLIPIMLGAAGYHATHSEAKFLPLTLVLAALAAFVAWGRLRAAPIPSR